MKKVMDLFLTEEAIRLAYVQASSVLLACVFLFWAPMTYTLWDIQQEQLRMAVYGELMGHMARRRAHV